MAYLWARQTISGVFISACFKFVDNFVICSHDINKQNIAFLNNIEKVLIAHAVTTTLFSTLNSETAMHVL